MTALTDLRSLTAARCEQARQDAERRAAECAGQHTLPVILPMRWQKWRWVHCTHCGALLDESWRPVGGAA